MLNPRSLLNVLLVSLLMTLAVSAQQPASDEKAEERKTGTITGRVVSDTGQPLANAGITVVPAVQGSSSQSRSATTASDGTFTVRGLDSLLFIVRANLPSYVTNSTEPAAPVYYRAGDNVNLQLIKGGVITGTVLTPNGEPVIGVPVRAFRLRSEGQISEVFAERTTDDRGIYRIYGLRPGNYIVAAGATNTTPFGGAYDVDGLVFAPSSNRQTAAEFTIHSGDETNVDIRYRPESTHEVSGVVKTATASRPVELFSIRMTSTSGMPPLTSYQMPGQATFFVYRRR
jgi:hypothetical protein